MRASAQCVNALKNIGAARCFSTPPAQTVMYPFKSPFRSPEAGSLFQVRVRECTGLPI